MALLVIQTSLIFMLSRFACDVNSAPIVRRFYLDGSNNPNMTDASVIGDVVCHGAECSIHVENHFSVGPGDTQTLNNDTLLMQQKLDLLYHQHAKRDQILVDATDVTVGLLREMVGQLKNQQETQSKILEILVNMQETEKMQEHQASVLTTMVNEQQTEKFINKSHAFTTEPNASSQNVSDQQITDLEHSTVGPVLENSTGVQILKNLTDVLVLESSTGRQATEKFTLIPVSEESTIEPSTIGPVMKYSKAPENSTVEPALEHSTDGPDMKNSTDDPALKHSTVMPVMETTTDRPHMKNLTVGPVLKNSTVRPVMENSIDGPNIKNLTGTDSFVLEHSTVDPVMKHLTDGVVTNKSTASPILAHSTIGSVMHNTTLGPVMEHSTSVPALEHSTVQHFKEHSTKQLSTHPMKHHTTRKSPTDTSKPTEAHSVIHTGTDCTDIAKKGSTTNGLYTITPNAGSGSYQVFCDMKTNNGGWTVFQRRQDGVVDFYREWDDYKVGFGLLQGEHWLGLEKVHSLTSEGTWELRVDMEDFKGNTAHATYTDFRIGNETTFYKIILGEYQGDAGDGLKDHSNQAFTTKDRDHDAAFWTNCAQEGKGAWWYHGRCHTSNLNGLYLEASSQSGAGIVWFPWKNSREVLKKTEMKIRRVK